MPLFYCVINWSLDTSGILLRRVDARGEKLDEFGAIGAYGSKSFVTINELGIAQKLS